ncbi:MFS transporter [Pseudovibrio exalbescens]|uniref:MFS transporter n=1 Tax=Pseudovibrio exalbescens TaxID=197461 RepID=UPI002366DC90|nr:MFS transporter [Pseudovibrio exalbescens]MDD7912008.1 MFS transporter [Pseudovibrio exalbescens]
MAPIFWVTSASAYHQAVLIAIVPVLCEVFQTDIGTIGVLVGGGLALSAAAVWVWGKIAHRFGLLVSLKAAIVGSAVAVTGLSLSAAATLAGLLPAASGLAAFFAARLLYSASAPAMLPLGQALAHRSSRTAADLLKDIGRLNGFIGVGRVAGNLSLPSVVAIGGAPLWLLSGPLPLYLCALWKLRGAREDGQRPEPEAAPVPRHRTDLPKLATALGIQITTGLSYILLGPLIQSVLQVGAQQSAALTGLCLALALVAGTLAQLGVKQLVGRHLLAGQLIAALLGTGALAWLGFGETFASVLGATILLAMATAVVTSVNTTRALCAAPRADGARAATRVSSVQFAGLALGSVAGGYLGTWDISAAFWLASVCFFLAGLIVPLCGSHEPRPDLQHPKPIAQSDGVST